MFYALQSSSAFENSNDVAAQFVLTDAPNPQFVSVIRHSWRIITVIVLSLQNSNSVVLNKPLAKFNFVNLCLSFLEGYFFRGTKLNILIQKFT